MYRTIAALLAVVALGACAKHDTKAQEERERTIMMEKLIQAAEQHAADAGTAPPAPLESSDAH